MSVNIAALQKTLAANVAAEAKQAVEEEREVTDEILGVQVVLKYEGTHGRGSITVYSGVFLNGEHFGTEVEYHPWSVFESISTSYNMCGLLLHREALRLIQQADVDDARAVEEPYPTETGPTRYYITTKTLESMVKIYLAQKEKDNGNVQLDNK